MVDVIEESARDLRAYGTVPIAFWVRSAFDVQVVDRGLGGIRLVERACEPPYLRDYDASEPDRPTHWADEWNLSNWGILAAFVDGVRAGGCAVAHDSPGVNMLEGRQDLAVVWDFRVHPDHRRQGVGARLWSAAEAWARHRGCRTIKVETQNTNVSACRFYAAQGCCLGVINRHAYTDYPDDAQLLWYKDL